MGIRIDERQMSRSDRPAGIALAMHMLRAMEYWRRDIPDCDCAMIMIAVIAITGERLLRAGLSTEAGSLDRPIDPAMLGRCNVSSIAHATGLNRETARRKVNDLISRGLLVRGEGGGIGLSPHPEQEAELRALIQRQVSELAGIANQLVKIGVLVED
jgi:hypothetical protein